MKLIKFGFAISASMAALVPAALTRAETSAGKCDVAGLNGKGVAGLTIASATLVGATESLPAHCEVIGTVTTKDGKADPGSAGVKMVLPSAWNGKFLFTGGGGFDGSFIGFDAQGGLKKGYAVVGTDSGHKAHPSSIINDASWAITAPGVPDEPPTRH